MLTIASTLADCFKREFMNTTNIPGAETVWLIHKLGCRESSIDICHYINSFIQLNASNRLSFSVLTLLFGWQEGHPATTHHLHHLQLRWNAKLEIFCNAWYILAEPGAPGKWPLKQRKYVALTVGDVIAVVRSTQRCFAVASEAICKWGAQCRRFDFLMCPLTFSCAPTWGGTTIVCYRLRYNWSGEVGRGAIKVMGPSTYSYSYSQHF